MSVRRLAKEQPASFAFSKATKQKADWWIAKYPADRRQSAVIPILWLVQKQEGWVSEPALRAIADMLGMAYIRVLEVATFYTMFQLEPVGTTALVQVCGTTPCMLRGAYRLGYLEEGRGFWEANLRSLVWMSGAIFAGQMAVRFLPPMAWLSRDLRTAGRAVWSERLGRWMGRAR